MRETRRRPLRVPPSVPLGGMNPPFMTAGAMGTWELSLTLPRAIRGDALLLWLGGHRGVKLDIICQNDDPSKEGYVSAKVDGRMLEPLPRPRAKKIHEMMRVAFRIPAQGIPPGSTIRFILGDPSHGSPGMRAPPFWAENIFFPVTLEPRPTSLSDHEFNWIGAFIFDITGGPLRVMRILAPSQAKIGEEIRLTIRPQDRLGNISHEHPESLLVRVDGKTTRISVGETDLIPPGVIQVRGLSIHREGVFRIEVRDPDRNLTSRSNPIVVGQRGRHLYWGVIHEHTEVSDGVGSLDACYRNMRYGAGLDFGAVSDHDDRFETTDEMWQMTKDAASRHNDPGSFTTFLGYEWAKWRRNGDGDRNVYYPGEDGEMYRSETGEHDRPDKLFEALDGQEALVIPHHTAYIGNFCDWSQHDPRIERLVEIYSVWGSAERAAEDGNPFPVRNPRAYDPRWIAYSGETPSLGEAPVGFVQNALQQGWMIGFTAGGDMHRSHPGDDVTRGFPPYRYKTGLTGIWAEANTRRSLWASLKSRYCYGTTGSRMIISMGVNGHPMGSEISRDEATTRRIECEIHGTDRIDWVELVRNNRVFRREEGVEQEDAGFEWMDLDDLGASMLPPTRWSQSPFMFYYLRVRQMDGEMGWASPVWIR